MRASYAAFHASESGKFDTNHEALHLQERYRALLPPAINLLIASLFLRRPSKLPKRFYEALISASLPIDKQGALHYEIKTVSAVGLFGRVEKQRTNEGFPERERREGCQEPKRKPQAARPKSGPRIISTIPLPRKSRMRIFQVTRRGDARSRKITRSFLGSA